MPGDAAERPIVLVGFMGAGKTTVGRLVAQALDREFADSDDVLTARTGRTPREIFATDGEAAFRALERDVVADLVRTGGARVVSLGGGAAETPSTREVLRDAAVVVHLDVSYAAALERVGGDPERPVLARADLADLYERRRRIHTDLADASVSTDGRTPRQVADGVLGVVGDPARRAEPDADRSRPHRGPGRSERQPAGAADGTASPARG